MCTRKTCKLYRNFILSRVIDSKFNTKSREENINVHIPFKCLVSKRNNFVYTISPLFSKVNLKDRNTYFNKDKKKKDVLK